MSIMIIGFSDFGSCGGFCDFSGFNDFWVFTDFGGIGNFVVLVIKVGFVLQSFRLFVIGLLTF